MARPRGIPSRRFHTSGQSVVTLDGKSFYLGPHDAPELNDCVLYCPMIL